MHVFVSYTLRDGVLNENDLRALERALSPASAAFIDLLHNKDVLPQRRVEDELERATLLLACRTPGFFDSEWVQFEIQTARKRGIPIYGFDLPPSGGGNPRNTLLPNMALHLTALARRR
jgi:hypothetical protein